MDNQIKRGNYKTSTFFSLIKIAFRNIFRNKRRSIMSIIAIGVAVFFIIFMMSFMNGMINNMIKVVRIFETSDVVISTKEFHKKKDFYPLQYPVEPKQGTLDELMEKIKKIDKVKAVFPRIRVYATLTDSTVKHAILWGIDFENEAKITNFNIKTKSSGLVKGRFFEKKPNGHYKNECIIGERLAKKMKLGIGDRIPMKFISSQYSDKYYAPTIVGLTNFNYATIDSHYIILPFSRLQKIGAMRNKTQTINIFLENKKYSAKVAAAVKKLLNNPDLEIRQWNQHFFVAYMKSAEVIYGIIYGVFIIVASFLIINTIIMVIHERIKEIGMMGALGMKRGEIVLVFFYEAILLSIFGSIFGSLIGALATGLGSFYPIDIMKMTGGIEFPASNTIFMEFSLAYIVKGFLFGVIISSLCTILPSMKSAFIEPVEALRR